MNTYQHILLAVDLSASSTQVAAKAREIAAINQAKLSIIHVIEIVPLIDVNYDAVTAFNPDMYDLLVKNAEKNLANFVTDTNIQPQQTFLEQGDARDEILRVVQENQVDLIIMGSHGRRGLALLLGSTVNSVLHHTHCDVLAVRLQDE